jgi:hypothetical protein
MKKIFLIVILVKFSMALFSQNTNNCTQAISNFTFQSIKREVQNQNSDIQRLSIARQSLNNNCFSSSQIKELSELFQDDFARLEFAKAGYDRLTDRANFYDVYNTFAYFSTVFMLHDYVLEKRGGQNNISNPNNNQPRMVTFPNLNYPNHLTYAGLNKCSFPLAEDDFMIMARDIQNLNGDEAKINKLGEYFQQNICFTASQLMRFSTLLQLENNRLNYLKRMYERCFDVNNLQQATQVFANQFNQQNFTAFLQQQNTQNNPAAQPVVCSISDAEFQDIRKRITNENFNNARLNMAKTLLRVKKCFSSAQVREITKVFSFDKDKLDIAKFAYDFTTDKQNYYTISDVFTFQNDKQAFLNFINSKK